MISGFTSRRTVLLRVISMVLQSQCSCITQLLECLNDWTLALDNKDNLDAIYLDFAKAFDSVPHKRLLFKLKGLGIVEKKTRLDRDISS